MSVSSLVSDPFQAWSLRWPEDAARWQLEAQLPQEWSPPTSWSMPPCSTSHCVAVGVATLPPVCRWLEGEERRQALVVVTDWAELAWLRSQHALLQQSLGCARCTVRYWPRSDLAGCFSFPALFLKAFTYGDCRWFAAPGREEELCLVQSAAHSTLSLLLDLTPGRASAIGHIWSNLSALSEMRDLRPLEGSFEGCSVVIAGGGPSLQGALAALQQRSPEVLLFAGGSALPALGRAGIRPDLVAAIDPSYDGGRARQAPWDHLPAVTSLRCHPATVASLPRPLALGPSTSGTVHESLALHACHQMEALPPASSLDVVGYLTEVALFCGARHIHLVGRDLCWEQAPYVADTLRAPTQALPISLGGQPAWTTGQWLAIAAATTSLVTRHPEVEWTQDASLCLPVPGVQRLSTAQWMQARPGAFPGPDRWKEQFMALPTMPVSPQTVVAAQKMFYDLCLTREACSERLPRLLQRELQGAIGLHQRLLGLDAEEMRFVAEGCWRSLLCSEFTTTQTA